MVSISEQTTAIQAFIKTHQDVSKINEKEVSDFYIQLIDCIIDHNHLYYIENKPIISDKQYDEMFDYLKKIEQHFPHLITSNSPTQILIGQINEGFVQAKHETKLMSLENTYNEKDLEERDIRIKKILEKKIHQLPEILYGAEPKFDGISVELIYKKGVFTQAITRGDGRVGEDITENVKMIKNIPKQLFKPIDINVRGEILMPKSVWKEINKEREEEGETPFANTRNAAAGSIKLLDPKQVAKRNLICYVYDILKYGNDEILKSGGPLNFEFGLLNKLGLPVFPRKKSGLNIREIIDLCKDEETKKYLEHQDSEFDGLVIKVENKDYREIIGSTDHHPKRAVAYKFPAQLAATQILSIDFQVGRTGIITPVANFEPVQLSGATLKRVSLHNFDFIKEKDIHLYDWIWLQRSGEVIPYIVSVITDRRIGKEITIHPPKICPSCNQLVTNKDIHYYCTNSNCKEKIKQQIKYFVSKNCMDIKGIGENIINLLVEQNIIKNIADIYKITDKNIQIQLLKFPGFGEKKIAEIIKGIEESKHKALRRLINSLGIPHVGKKMSQDIAEAINNQKQIINNDFLSGILHFVSNKEFLGGIYGIGEKTIESIINFFNIKENIKLLKQLVNYGVNIDPKKYVDYIKTNESKGNFSITGGFDIAREKIIEFFQQHGYCFHENPTKTTDFILVGEKAGNKKNKAQKLGIIIYEGWNTITKQFPFIKKITNKQIQPKIQRLF